jgi:hypothetical protein
MEKPDSEEDAREVVFVLRDGVVKRSPYEHLQFRKVLFDNAQYTLILARRLRAGG